jgi:hypothetical protein
MPAEPHDHLGLRSLLASIRDGRAGFAVRLTLSVAAAGLALGALFLILGLAEQRGGLLDETIFLSLAIAGAAWLGLLYLLWRTYGRWRRALSTGFCCLGILIAAIGIATFFGATVRRSEFLIAGTIATAIAAIIVVIASGAVQAARGRRVRALDGSVDVGCPRCGYSMNGLAAAACPECGCHYTLDQLIAAQGYDGVAPRSGGAGPGTDLALPAATTSAAPAQAG